MFLVACGLYIWWFIKFNNCGWNKWEKQLDIINEDGVLKIPVEIKWDFVDISIGNIDIKKDVDVIIKVINTGKQSLSIRCGHYDLDKIMEGQLVHESIGKDEVCLVFNGSLNEFTKNWECIRIKNYDGKIKKTTIIIESTSVDFKNILVVARWWSYGL